MSLEAKVNLLLSGQAALATSIGAVLTAVQNAPGVNTAAITTALAQLETQVAAIQTTIGSDSSASGSSAAGASSAPAGTAAATTAQGA